MGQQWLLVIPNNSVDVLKSLHDAPTSVISIAKNATITKEEVLLGLYGSDPICVALQECQRPINLHLNFHQDNSILLNPAIPFNKIGARSSGRRTPNGP
ncbi:hypothetical protein AVEN_69617-1 [Araneus ventricosus]|uniref:Uncharacterized protein n=1 Tax=Araneus ventricosus TaxID=182803 RepID=A0A4Y2GBR1_ARAVE|nr:hypothetical protein AVEN_69617-1 [Araneus ventricosus]